MSCREAAHGSASASYLMLRGKATAAKAGELFDLAGQMLREVQLDERDRVVEMLRDQVASLEAALVSSGSAFAASRVRAQYGAAGHAHEQLSGLEQLHAALRPRPDPNGSLRSRREQLEHACAAPGRLAEDDACRGRGDVVLLAVNRRVVKKLHSRLKGHLQKW